MPLGQPTRPDIKDNFARGTGPEHEPLLISAWRFQGLNLPGLVSQCAVAHMPPAPAGIESRLVVCMCVCAERLHLL